MKILLIGFDDIEVEGLRIILSGLGEIISVPQEAINWTLEEILERSYSGFCGWTSRKFVVIHKGDEYIKEIIRRVKFLDLGKVIFATTTPTSLQWPLSKLLDELIAEDLYFNNRLKVKSEFLSFTVKEDSEKK